jgi:hypothetical protein
MIRYDDLDGVEGREFGGSPAGTNAKEWFQ